jgi:hypothetical protein
MIQQKKLLWPLQDKPCKGFLWFCKRSPLHVTVTHLLISTMGIEGRAGLHGEISHSCAQCKDPRINKGAATQSSQILAIRLNKGEERPRRQMTQVAVLTAYPDFSQGSSPLLADFRNRALDMLKKRSWPATNPDKLANWTLQPPMLSNIDC